MENTTNNSGSNFLHNLIFRLFVVGIAIGLFIILPWYLSTPMLGDGVVISKTNPPSGVACTLSLRPPHSVGVPFAVLQAKYPSGCSSEVSGSVMTLVFDVLFVYAIWLLYKKKLAQFRLFSVNRYLTVLMIGVLFIVLSIATFLLFAFLDLI